MNFIDIGDEAEEIPGFAELETIATVQLEELFAWQFDYISKGKTESEILALLEESREEFDKRLFLILLPLLLFAFKYAKGIIGKVIPGFDYEEEAIRLLKERIKIISDKIFETTRKRLLELLKVGTLDSYLDAVIGTRPSIIIGYESIFLLNKAIAEVARESGIVAFLRWITIGDEAVCRICKPNDRVLFPLSSENLIPSHFGCRCRWALVIDVRGL